MLGSSMEQKGHIIGYKKACWGHGGMSWQHNITWLMQRLM